MAEVLYDLNDPEDVQRWSKQLMRETIPKVMSQAWGSEGQSSPLHIKTDLQKAAGSTINFFLRVKGSGAGVQGDDELEGKEEGMTQHKDTLVIDQLRHAFKSGGKMSEQRVTWAVRSEIKDLASDWMAERLETWFFNLACGYTVQTDTRYTGLMGAPTAPTTVFRPNNRASDDLLVEGDEFDLDLLDKAVNKAKIMSPQLRPVKTEGGEYYICVLHPNTVRTLRDSESLWYGQMQAAMQGGAIANNPLFTGALGASNGCVFFENNYVTSGTDAAGTSEAASAKRNVLLGAQAIVQGWGQKYGPGQFDWAEVPKDYGNKLGVAVGLISGMTKTVFNSVDYGVIVLPSFAPDPS